MSIGLSLEDRIIGCLLGGALGDAVGAGFEGSLAPSDFSIPADLRVTDDTQLTIATCEAIIKRGIAEPESIASRLVHWFRNGRLSGLGSSTLKALTDLSVGMHWGYVGAVGEYSAGNGAAMRIAPVAFLLDPDNSRDRRTIRDIAFITHRNDEAYIGALIIIRSIRFVLAGHPLDRSLFSYLIDTLPDSRVRDRLIEVDSRRIRLADYSTCFQSTGYVVDSVPLAVLAATESMELLPTLRAIIHVGGDTDTVASMCGQILGTAHGSDFLASQHLDDVDQIDLVREVAVEFARIVNR